MKPPRLGHRVRCTTPRSVLELFGSGNGDTEVRQVGHRHLDGSGWFDVGPHNLGFVLYTSDGWEVHQRIGRDCWEMVATCVTFQMAVTVLDRCGKYATLYRIALTAKSSS